MPRHDGRADDESRPLSLERGFVSAAPGSVLVRCGRTTVLCTASVSEDVPPWLRGQGKGWVTAEYSMLPGSTAPRKSREKGKPDGRSTEIQRLIGRSLRAGVDLQRLGERLITVDCDVLLADGGTRTASITGGWVALADAIGSIRNEDGELAFAADVSPLVEQIAAVSVGVVDGEVVVDLDYPEDAAASVDMNLVMTDNGQPGGARFVEVQGSGEEATFSADELARMTQLGAKAIERIATTQRAALAG